jgi:hypothetical protein
MDTCKNRIAICFNKENWKEKVERRGVLSKFEMAIWDKVDISWQNYRLEYSNQAIYINAVDN